MQLKMPSVTTKRLYVRPLEIEDASDLLEIYANPKVMMGNAGIKPITSMDGMLRYLQYGYLAYESWQIPQSMVLERLSDGLVIGIMQFHTLKERVGELGFFLAESQWHQGYMQEGLRVMVALGFQHLNLHRIEAQYDPSNQASGRLLERLGFVKEGILREVMLLNDDVYHDLMMCSVLTSEYKNEQVWEHIDTIQEEMI